MRTRKAEGAKPATPKKTLPGRKSATKAKKTESPPTAKDVSPATDVAPDNEGTPPAKVETATPKSTGGKVSGRTKGSASAEFSKSDLSKSEESVMENVKGNSRDESNANNIDGNKKNNSAAKNVDEPGKKQKIRKRQEVIGNAGELVDKEKGVMDADETVVEKIGQPKNSEQTIKDLSGFEKNENSLKQKKDKIVEDLKLGESEGSGDAEEEVLGKMEDGRVNEFNNGDNESMLVATKENPQEGLQKEDAQVGKELSDDDDGMEEYGDRVDFGDHLDDDLGDDDGDDPAEEHNTLEEEHKELSAVAKERKIRKEREIFLGGLDRDAVEEDIRKVFERIGEIVEIRLHKNVATNKNKGYAFVQFANKEHAKRALVEMKNPVIRGKRCGTAPSEDNDMLFLGNICNTWTKEAIRQKLKDYGVERVENITLVPDLQHEGLSRGFAFLEFSCHADAMMAYRRLQKPDVIFGHPERTAKVAFAEPLRDPDPDVMAQVKSVFIDGLPPHWDEARVKEQLKCCGEIVRIMLARNMPSARRKDYAFVDFSTHEAAVACVDGISNSELVDGKTKIKVRARLSNPMPKSQAIKGGMCGGFRIGRGGVGNVHRYGWSFGRGRHAPHQGNYHGKSYHHGMHSQGGRMGFRNDFERPYSEFHGRQYFGQGGGRRGSAGTSYYHGAAAPGSSSGRSFDRRWHNAPGRGHGRHFYSRRLPYSQDEQFEGPFGEQQFDDQYYYDDSPQGTKRPFYADQDSEYFEPDRVRPRFDYNDPAVHFRGSNYRDACGAGSGSYSYEHYGAYYMGGLRSPFYEEELSYGGDRYY